MNKESRVLAIIPARGGSKGIPRKNIIDFNGAPLLSYTINQAHECALIDRVLVNSEDKEIRQVAMQYGADVMSRPNEFHHDNSIQEVDRMLYWIVGELEKNGEEYDIIVLMYPTAPLRNVDALHKAISMVQNEAYDSVLSVYEDSTYLWRLKGDEVEPTNYNPETRGPRQKEDWNQWAENKAVYAFRKDLLMSTKCRLGGKIGSVEMSKLESIDIDGLDDLEIAKLIHSRRLK
ncbi:cytidylyltransferase domain-containing protein [Roseivirga sp.]|uniref:acylneuraminate cytidylyltransferase family protein n=1 Tax=Roseivirga sp. TaxID=1964215 RepID=UPI003B8B9A4B